MDDIPVAVRSSAVVEDSEFASFAGQHKSYVNVVGLENVTRAVKDCWSSAQALSAQTYRKRTGLSEARADMAVIIQRFVNTEVSAVVFTANPVTGNQDEIVIDANWGLGESIVSGAVTPDTFVIRKSDLAILRAQVNDKSVMAIPKKLGTHQVQVELLNRSVPSLTNPQIAEISTEAIRLQHIMDRMVDIECGFEKGKFWLFQCRPITTPLISKHS
jgi:pyruvate,water dikinase